MFEVDLGSLVAQGGAGVGESSSVESEWAEAESGGVVKIREEMGGSWSTGEWRRFARAAGAMEAGVEGVELRDGQAVLLVTSEEEWERARVVLVGASGVRKALGLDVECLPTAVGRRESRGDQGGPALAWESVRQRNNEAGRDPLLQLAAEGVAVLVRLCAFRHLPNSLVALCRDPGYVKLGVDIFEDALRLNRDWGLSLRGCLDLRAIASASPKFKKLYNGNKFNLKSIGRFLHLDISQDFHVATSDWGAPYLTRAQIEYAARDALVGANAYAILLTDFFDCEKYSPDSAKFWRFFREKRFWSFRNRPWANNRCATKTKKTKDSFQSGSEDRGGEDDEEEEDLDEDATEDKAAERRERRFWRQQTASAHADRFLNSDSDLDFDFASERSRKAAQLPPPALVWFNLVKENQSPPAGALTSSEDDVVILVNSVSSPQPSRPFHFAKVNNSLRVTAQTRQHDCIRTVQ